MHQGQRDIPRLQRIIVGILPAPFLPLRPARFVRSRTFAFLTAVIAAMMLNATVRSARDDREKWGQRVPTVVASHPIAAGSAIGVHDISVVPLPRIAVPVGSSSSTAAVLGNRARVPLSPGQVITAGLISARQVSAAELLIGDGRVGVSVETGRARPALTVGATVIVIPSPGPSSQSAATVEGTVIALEEDFVTLAVEPAAARDLGAMVGSGPLLVGLKGTSG